MNSTDIDNGNGVFFTESSNSKAIKFGILLSAQIISIPCYVFIIFYMISRRLLHNTLYNHVIFISLLLNFPVILINFSLHLIYIRLDFIVPSVPSICLLWQYLDYGFWFGDLCLKLWASAERHILIFHSNFLKLRMAKIFLHYVPLALFTLYCPLIYFYLVFLYPTPHLYDYNVLLCGGPYYYNDISSWLIWYESLAHYVVPVFLIILLAAVLPIRVFWQKSRRHVNNRWRQYRKMTIQLINIAVTYVFTLPYIIVTIVRWSGYPAFGTNVQGSYLYYCAYMPNLLFPIATILSISSLRKKIFRCSSGPLGGRSGTIVPLSTVHAKKTEAI